MVFLVQDFLGWDEPKLGWIINVQKYLSSSLIDGRNRSMQHCLAWQWTG